jgi:hypothetical protein
MTTDIEKLSIMIDKIYNEEYIIYTELIKNIEYIKTLKEKHTELISIFTKIITNLYEKPIVY